MVETRSHFSGEVSGSIDGKGRVCVPSRFREFFDFCAGDPNFFITKSSPVAFGNGSFGRGVSIYPAEAWQKIRDKILGSSAGFTALQLNSLKRQIINPAEPCSLDKLGRFLVPAALRSHASLDKEIWFVGMGERLDIWSSETYSMVVEQDEKNFPFDSEELAVLGV